MEVVVDLSIFDVAKADNRDEAKTQNLESDEMYQDFVAFKAHVEALSLGVTFTVNTNNVGQEVFRKYLVRTGKKHIVCDDLVCSFLHCRRDLRATGSGT